MKRLRLYGTVTSIAGVWELVAISGMVPTVTHTVRAACRRWPAARLLVCLYTAGLARHLLDQPKDMA